MPQLPKAPAPSLSCREVFNILQNPKVYKSFERNKLASEFLNSPICLPKLMSLSLVLLTNLLSGRPARSTPHSRQLSIRTVKEKNDPPSSGQCLKCPL